MSKGLLGIGHFLIGCHGEAAPTLNEVSAAEALKSKWKRAQLAATHYWRRWIREYLPQMHKREKWQIKVPPLKIGDIVVFPNEQRLGRWIKGRIVEVHTAADKQVRSVTIKCLDAIVKRPVCKVAKLSVSKD